MRYLSLFSGIEAASVAWEPLGWEPIAFCEIDPFPSAVLAYRFPNVPNLGDITKVDWDEFKEKHGSVDLIVGGSPCQSFSVAGGRAGLDGESRLMFEYIRAVSEIRPTWFLWENVPGVFSIDGGRAFGILLDEMAQLGYGLAWATLDAQFFGVAQRRRRVFLVGRSGMGAGCVSVLFDSESVSGNTLTSREKREQLTQDAGRCVAIQSDKPNNFTYHARGYSLDGSAFTLNCLDRQSVIASGDDEANASREYDILGTLKARCDRAYIAADVTGALAARDYKGVGNQYVEEGKLVIEKAAD